MKRKFKFREDIEQMSEPLHSLCVLKHSPEAVRRLNSSKEGNMSEDLHVDQEQMEVVKADKNKFEIQPKKEKKKWYKTFWGIIAGIAVIVGLIVGIIQLILWIL
ncbi:MAG: hypothetical protein JSV88_21780 [Candidatus Aminicenantes bacterium]|nr:MAG: hypothetical protein JSV88_21780 [Candidatus Aminicenantes bacterium]